MNLKYQKTLDTDLENITVMPINSTRLIEKLKQKFLNNKYYRLIKIPTHQKPEQHSSHT